MASRLEQHLRAKPKTENFGLFTGFFLSAVWLPHGRFFAVIEETVSLPNVNHCIWAISFRPRADWKGLDLYT